MNPFKLIDSANSEDEILLRFKEHPEKIRYCINQLAKNGETLIMKACKRSRPKVLEFLLNNFNCVWDINYQTITAVAHRNEHIANFSPLMYATYYDAPECFQILLKHNPNNIDIYKEDYRRYSPFKMIISSPSDFFIKELLKNDHYYEKIKEKINNLFTTAMCNASPQILLTILENFKDIIIINENEEDSSESVHHLFNI